jgi:hypothetical protein
MADNPSGPVGPDDHYRFQDEPPGPAGGGAPRPKPPRPPERSRRPRPARQDRDAGKGAGSPSGGAPFPWLKPQPMTVKNWIALAAILVPLLGFAAGMAIWQNQHRAWEQTVFGAAMDDYLAPTVTAPPGTPPPAFGKAVMVDTAERKLHYFQESLPDDLRAATPAEVTTVVQLRFTDQEVGWYVGGGRALKVTCNVTVVDRASHVVLGTASFTGADPPLVTSAHPGEDVRGTLPVKDIIDFLKQLRKG